MMLAAGILLVMVRLIGSTVSTLGATPKEHFSIAPLQTCMGIRIPHEIRSHQLIFQSVAHLNLSWRTLALYLALKHLHVTTVILSLALFVLRGIWMLIDSPQLRRRWVRIVPHMIDTVLLASAIGLMLLLHQYPFVHGWLTAKVLGLIAYILLGSIALKYGPTKPIRTVAWIAALMTFGYIVSVALTHTPQGFLLWL